MLVVCALFSLVPFVSAQDDDGNLLRDGGFEGSYLGRAGRGDLNIPEGWNVWFTESPRNEYWQNLPPVAFPHIGPDPSPRSGARALNLTKDYATFTAAVYQQVGVPEGANVRARVHAWLYTCNIPEGRDKCDANGDSGAFVRVGIDPNGGTDPNDGDIVWSGNGAPYGGWGEIAVDATASGGTVTLFLYATQAQASNINRVYWDDASLRAEGDGGSAGGDDDDDDNGGDGGGSSAPSTVGFVSRQGEREDGSIVHTVQAGDTVDSIAVAYGVTRADILALNNMTDPRIIQIGQQLVIRPPDDAGDADEDAEDSDESSAEGDEQDSENADEEAAEDEDSEGDDGDSEAEPVRDPRLDAPPAPVVSVASGDVLPAANPAEAAASVCVTLFEDANQNRIQEEGERLLADGTIRLSVEDSPVDEYRTDGAGEPYCFERLVAGEYIAVAVAPGSYGLTTPNQLRVQVNAGARVNIAFGAAEGVPPMIPPPADSGELADEVVAEPEELEAANLITNNIGLIVFGLAAVVLVGGISVSLLMRR
jgi:LysM repeat protein